MHAQHETNPIYLRVSINPWSRIVSLSNEVSTREGFPKEQYFQRFQSWRIERAIPTGSGKPAARIEYFHVGKNDVLLERFKHQELFSNDLGTIVAETRLQYESEYGPGYGAPCVTIDVRADTSGILRERPTLIADLPRSAEPLHMITVVRFSNLQRRDIAAVGTYSAGGELVGVAEDILKPGQYPSPTKPMTMDEATENSIRQFGFPLRFSVDEFRKAPTALYERDAGPTTLTIISFHFARNRWIQQYVFADSLASSTHYERRVLEFRSTPEDEALRLLDEALPWKPWGERPLTLRGR
jgi:hypothetical protein